MALKHAILSALSRGVPRNGYELNAVFNDEDERAWNASPSQVYAELTKMAAAGLIEVSSRSGRRATSYVLTEDGLDELKRWLEHDEPDHTTRDDAMMRMLTMWTLEPTTARHLIESEIAFQRRRARALRYKLDAFEPLSEDTAVWRNRRAVHVLWLRQTQVMVDWLHSLIEVLEHPERTVSDILDETSLASDVTASEA